MKNVFRGAISAGFLGLGAICFANGNPDWLTSLGFTDGVLPAIFIVLGLGLGAVTAIIAWPTTESAQKSQG